MIVESEREKFEVIVVGGGMVGATTACILARDNVKVALLDVFNPDRQWSLNSVDIRVSALTKASQNILEAIGAWPGMVSRGVSPYREMQVWDARADGELHFDCADTEFNELGHIVENRVTIAALWDLLESLPDATIICPAKVADMQIEAEGRRLLLEDGRSLEAELVIAADGRDSALRAMTGIDTTGWNYQQDGLVATVSTRASHRATAWQRFLEQGPLAFLPLKNGQSSIVWTLGSETARDYLALPDKEFLQVLQEASAGILGDMLEVGPRAAFPLRLQYANRYVDQCFALIGDAAHAMHPLAGQGANAGLLDAAAIAELVVQAKQQGRSFSGQRLLRKYERWRKGDNLFMMGSMDLIKRVYGMSLRPLMRLRSTGMNQINNTAILRNFLNRYAMGLRDDLPGLAKGKIT